MATLPPVPNTLKFTLHWSVGPDLTAATIVHYEYSGGPPNTADCITLAALLCSGSAAHWPALCGTLVSLQGATCLDLNSNTGAEGFSPTAWTGTRTGADSPANIAAVINHQIARRYRGGKPKSFLPFGTQPDYGNLQHWGSSAVSAFGGGANSVFQGLIGSAADSTTITHFVNVSYYQGYNPPVTQPSGRVRQSPKLRTTPVIDVISASTCAVRMGTQRRRLGKGV